MVRILAATAISSAICLAAACGQTSAAPVSPTAVACALTISPSSQSAPRAGGSFHASVSGSCPWSTASEQSWIAVTHGQGAEIGTVTYDVLPNTGAEARQGHLRIGAQSLTVSQSGPDCSYAVAPASFSVGSPGGAFEARVATRAECPWTASTGDSWIEIRTPSGNGPQAVSFAVSGNTGTAARRATIRVADQTLQVVQAEPDAPQEPVPPPANPPGGGQCTYSLNASPTLVPAGGGSLTLEVSTGVSCHWSSSSPDPWIGAASGARTGSGSVTVAVRANSGGARAGRIEVDKASIVISQEPAALPVVCSYSVSASPGRVPASGGSVTLEVVTSAVCAWSPSSPDAWIEVPPGARTGSGTVGVDVAANTGAARSGRIEVGGTSVVLSQDARVVPVECSFTLVPAANPVPARGGDFTLDVFTDARCTWSASSSTDWIGVSSTPMTGSGKVTFGVRTNSGDGRSGRIDVGTASVSVSQEAAPCVTSVGPKVHRLPAGAAESKVGVTARDGCAWSVKASPWILGTPASGKGSMGFLFNVETNSGSERSGIISIDGHAVDVIQAGVK